MASRRILVLAVALFLAARGDAGDPGSRPADAGTGGLATGGGAGLSVTGGSSGTGGAGTGGAQPTGGSSTGGMVAPGGAKTGGSSGTGGAAVAACSFAPATTHGSSTEATIGGCGSTKPNDWMRLRFTADGALCMTCTVKATNKQAAGCFTEVIDPRFPVAGKEVLTKTFCAESCAACPVERCFSTGSDYGTEYPCD